MTQTLRLIVIPLLLAGASLTFADIYLQGVGDDHARSFKHDRFYDGADRAFVAEDLGLSGVGHGHGWATMISPQYFLSANHLHPRPGTQVTFWETNSNADYRTNA